VPTRKKSVEKLEKNGVKYHQRFGKHMLKWKTSSSQSIKAYTGKIKSKANEPLI